jgi:phosphoserine phosphatase RsbU/P
LNEALIERKVEARYVTLLVLLWDPQTRQMVMANAGALPPMICRNGELVKIRVEGVPLGLLDARDYEEAIFQAEAGDTVLLYSDGVTDHLSGAGTDFGRGRLAQVVRANCDRSADALIAALFEELDRFARRLFDDQTVFAMKVK